MSNSERLAALSLELPNVATPVGSYLPAKLVGDVIHTSGQLPLKGGELTSVGKVPGDVSAEQAAEAAALAALNGLAAAAAVAGGIDKLTGVARVGVFVNSSAGFFQQPAVANGASDLLVKIFGDAGKHARAAVGVAELPLNAAVEVELSFEIAE